MSKQEHDRPLLEAIYNNNAAQYQSLLQSMTEVNNEVLVAIMSFKSSADVLNAVMNHPTIDPFYENNSLIKTIIDRDYSTDYLSAVLHHSKNKLTSDDYRAIINDMKPSSDKLTLIESLIL